MKQFLIINAIFPDMVSTGADSGFLDRGFKFTKGMFKLLISPDNLLI